MQIHIDPQFPNSTDILLNDDNEDTQCHFTATPFDDIDSISVGMMTPDGDAEVTVSPEEAVEMARALLRAVGKEHWLVDDEMRPDTFLAKIGM